MASPAAVARLRKEFARLEASPVEHIEAVPSDANILEWHYLIHGPPSSPYTGGLYHGKLVFPRDYPYRPPSILMLTPSGRFKTNTKLCLSMSDFHPETWNPLWSVSSILSGLLSFMLEDTATYGSMEATDDVRRALAQRSEDWNIDNDRAFNLHFPQYKERRDAQRALQTDARADGDDQGRKHARDERKQPPHNPSSSSPSPSPPPPSASARPSQSDANGVAPVAAVDANAAAPAKPHPDASLDKLVIAIIVASVAFGVMFLFT